MVALGWLRSPGPGQEVGFGSVNTQGASPGLDGLSGDLTTA